MEADVARKDKIAAAKKKVWFTVSLLLKIVKFIEPHARVVALKHYAYGFVVATVLPSGRTYIKFDTYVLDVSKGKKNSECSAGSTETCSVLTSIVDGSPGVV